MKLLAIDGNSILNRAFYSIKLLSNKSGIFTNAIVGFMNIYMKNYNNIHPDCCAIAFDRSTPTFRHKAAAYYKANRKGMPLELAQQFYLIKKLLTIMGVNIVECEGYEADDILGTLSKCCTDSGNQCFVLTCDRDSLQLIDENVTILLITNNGNIYFTPDHFYDEYGFEPISFIDFKALMGDSSDNIPGVAGIGKKTANMLIKKYGTIEILYEKYANSDDLKKDVKKKLKNYEILAKESKWLATIVRNVHIKTNLESYRLKEQDNASIIHLLTELEMYKLLEKLNVSVHIKEE